MLLQIIVGFKNVTAGFRRNIPASSLKLAYLVTAIFYNVTEAAFKVMTPVWIVFLFAILAVPAAPKRKREENEVAQTSEHPDPTGEARPISEPAEAGKLVYCTQPVRLF